MKTDELEYIVAFLIGLADHFENRHSTNQVLRRASQLLDVQDREIKRLKVLLEVQDREIERLNEQAGIVL